jgi:hypothetical protein
MVARRRYGAQCLGVDLERKPFGGIEWYRPLLDFGEHLTMPTVQIADEKTHANAIGLLIRMGGIFRTKPIRQLVVGPVQLLALQQAGLVPKTNGVTKRGKKPA